MRDLLYDSRVYVVLGAVAVFLCWYIPTCVALVRQIRANARGIRVHRLDEQLEPDEQLQGLGFEPLGVYLAEMPGNPIRFETRWQPQYARYLTCYYGAQCDFHELVTPLVGGELLTTGNAVNVQPALPRAGRYVQSFDADIVGLLRQHEAAEQFLMGQGKVPDLVPVEIAKAAAEIAAMDAAHEMSRPLWWARCGWWYTFGRTGWHGVPLEEQFSRGWARYSR